MCNMSNSTLWSSSILWNSNSIQSYCT